ncbi:uncharacterized protein BDW70DRAFT_57529 [Aspergillus foveolatus]|uniref:uncharacterized protein n=1 Tax=Aspergillus foveolatus TaxID=210207 RepID=UPI003CCCF6D0
MPKQGQKRKYTDIRQDDDMQRYKRSLKPPQRNDYIASIYRLTDDNLRKHRHQAYDLYVRQRPKGPRWRPSMSMHAATFVAKCSRAQIVAIQKFARNGGPDCSDIRGVC